MTEEEQVSPPVEGAGAELPEQQSEDQKSAPIDYEAEATKLGWSPLSEFKGDHKLFVDAENWYNRTNEYMPIAKATIKKLTTKLDRLEKDMEKDRAFFTKAEARAYEKALADIKAEQEAAVEVGDLEAHRAADKKLAALEKPEPAAKPDQDVRAEDFADWGKANRWYGENEVMRVYADYVGLKLAAKHPDTPLTAEDMQSVTDQVKAKFDDVYPDAFGGKANGTPRRSAVEAPSSIRPRANDNTAASLNSEERRQGVRFVEMGLFKKLDDYAKELRANG